MQGESRWTGPFTGHAGDAPLLFPVNLYQAESVEPAINRAQWAKVLAEGPVNLDREQDNGKQNPQLPEKQTACLHP